MTLDKILSPRWPNTPLSKYPHLRGSDIPIWNTWIRMYGQNFIGFDYDLHVGKGLASGSSSPLHLKSMWYDLTRKRIDVVGYRANEIWLIEVKERPMSASIGQILSYDVLYSRDFHPRDPIVLAIVAGIIEPDLETVLRHFAIRFHDLSDDHKFLTSFYSKPLLRAPSTIGQDISSHPIPDHHP